MNRKIYFVVNPQAANGHTGHIWPGLKEKIKAKFKTLDYGITEYTFHAAQLTASALERGFDLVVAVGGDGTLNEVLNGYFRSGKTFCPQAALGYLPGGTGGDFARSLGIYGLSHDEQLERLRKGRIRILDCGKACFRDLQGGSTCRLFINESSVGFSANTVIAVNQATKIWGGKLSFLMGVLRCLVSLNNPVLEVTVDDKPIFQGPTLLVAVSNGKYFGGSMMIAPHAQIDDGLFDIIIVGAMKRRTIIRKIGKIYQGNHLDEPEIRAARGRRVQITARHEKVLLEMDGEQAGSLTDSPVSFTICKKEISFLC